MFVWTADAIFGELALHLPKHVEHLTKAVEKMGTDRLEDVKHIVESMIAQPEAMTVSGIRSPP